MDDLPILLAQNTSSACMRLHPVMRITGGRGVERGPWPDTDLVVDGERLPEFNPVAFNEGGVWRVMIVRQGALTAYFPQIVVRRLDLLGATALRLHVDWGISRAWRLMPPPSFGEVRTHVQRRAWHDARVWIAALVHDPHERARAQQYYDAMKARHEEGQ